MAAGWEIPPRQNLPVNAAEAPASCPELRLLLRETMPVARAGCEPARTSCRCSGQISKMLPGDVRYIFNVVKKIEMVILYTDVDEKCVLKE